MASTLTSSEPLRLEAVLAELARLDCCVLTLLTVELVCAARGVSVWIYPNEVSAVKPTTNIANSTIITIARCLRFRRSIPKIVLGVEGCIANLVLSYPKQQSPMLFGRQLNLH